MADHVLKSIKPKERGFNAKDATDACFRYLTETIVVANCRRPKGISNHVTQCTCMRFLAKPEDEDTAMAVAEYMPLPLHMVKRRTVNLDVIISVTVIPN